MLPALCDDLVLVYQFHNWDKDRKWQKLRLIAANISQELLKSADRQSTITVPWNTDILNRAYLHSPDWQLPQLSHNIKFSFKSPQQ